MKKTQELKEIREMDDKNLFKSAQELEKKLADLEFALAFRKQKNIHEITAARKKMARVWTEINHRAIQKAKGLK